MSWDEFRERREQLRAWQFEWSQALWERIEWLSRDKNGRHRDARELARQAWADCAVQHAALRTRLDEHREELARCA